MESMIRDIKLAPSGHDKINWVKNFMPVMAAVDKEFSVSKPFAGKKMVITLHLEAKTAYMAEIFHHAGAEVAITGSNPLSEQLPPLSIHHIGRGTTEEGQPQRSSRRWYLRQQPFYHLRKVARWRTQHLDIAMG